MVRVSGSFGISVSISVSVSVRYVFLTIDDHLWVRVRG